MILFIHKNQFCIRTLRKKINGIKYYKCIFCGDESFKVPPKMHLSPETLSLLRK